MVSPTARHLYWIFNSLEQLQLYSSLLKTVAKRLKEKQVNKETNMTNKISEVKTIK